MTMTNEQLMARLAELEQQNAALAKAVTGGGKALTLKVSSKGAVSLYGMGRFPVTLYQEQWLKVLDFSDEIRSFVGANKGRLKTKAQAVAAGVVEEAE